MAGHARICRASSGLFAVFVVVVSEANAVERLEPATLKEIVFDEGQPWLIVCSGRSQQSRAHELIGKATTSEVFPAEASVGVLDCKGKLPSGKTSFERFSLDQSVTPTCAPRPRARANLDGGRDMCSSVLDPAGCSWSAVAK